MSTGFAILQGIRAELEDKMEVAVDIAEQALGEVLENKTDGTPIDENGQAAIVLMFAQRIGSQAALITHIAETQEDEKELAAEMIVQLHDNYILLAAYAIMAAESLLVE